MDTASSRSNSSPTPSVTVAITGASGALGQALIKRWHSRGAQVIALTHRPEGREASTLQVRDSQEMVIPLRQVSWQCGKESELVPLLAEVDVLVLNHGVNQRGRRDLAALTLGLEVNALSHWRLLELFAQEVAKRRSKGEVWVNTSEAEIQPALSPIYEISKRLMGQILSLRALDLASTPAQQGSESTLRVRRLVLGPFRSELNPQGLMSADWVAGEIFRQVGWNCNLIIVSIFPTTYVLMPLASLSRWIYGKLLTRGAS
ncbi:MAG: SDR family NAD(P)-dependent oxidoreductase [Cyanobacteriota bacterium]|nr:SDR family NAD(P)-dependent oxidoreductase [Cyanobacteriota bacterium]